MQQALIIFLSLILFFIPAILCFTESRLCADSYLNLKILFYTTRYKVIKRIINKDYIIIDNPLDKSILFFDIKSNKLCISNSYSTYEEKINNNTRLQYYFCYDEKKIITISVYIRINMKKSRLKILKN